MAERPINWSIAEWHSRSVSFKLLVFQLPLNYSFFFISVTVTNQLQLLVFQLFSVTGISVIFSYSYWYFSYFQLQFARKLGQLDANFANL